MFSPGGSDLPLPPEVRGRWVLSFKGIKSSSWIWHNGFITTCSLQKKLIHGDQWVFLDHFMYLTQDLKFFWKSYLLFIQNEWKFWEKIQTTAILLNHIDRELKMVLNIRISIIRNYISSHHKLSRRKFEFNKVCIEPKI